MTGRYRSYDVARSTFGFLEFLGWSIVVLGLLAGIGLAVSAGNLVSSGQKFMLFISGASGSLIGLFLVGSVQNWRAGIDTAEYTQQMLQIARDQLQVSKQGLAATHPTPATLKDAVTTPPVSAPLTAPKPKQAPSVVADDPERLIEFEGRQILIENGKYNVNGIPFGTRSQAENYIRNFARESDPKPDIEKLETAKRLNRLPPAYQPVRK